MMKKYILEPGNELFDQLLEGISEIIVAPVYLLEINSAIERRIREKSIQLEEASRIRKEVDSDIIYYSKVVWNDDLEEQALRLIQNHQIKTLDCIQLASGILSKADTFITSDRKLFHIAEIELNKAEFV